jgi:hypothetical protein
VDHQSGALLNFFNFFSACCEDEDDDAPEYEELTLSKREMEELESEVEVDALGDDEAEESEDEIRSEFGSDR